MIKYKDWTDGWTGLDWIKEKAANEELFINFKRLLPESLTPWKNNIKKCR